MRNPDDQAARWLQALEEYYYTIEVRAGSKHVNADALSRITPGPCGGKKCICPEVAEMEHQAETHVVNLHDDWRVMPSDETLISGNRPTTNAEAVETRRQREAQTAQVYSLAAIMVNAIIKQTWTAEQVAAEQATHADTALLYQHKKQNSSRPDWQQIESLGEAAMVYFHDWKRITLHENGILYRRWETVDGMHTYQQMLVPPAIRDLIFEQIHASITGSHMGFKRTMRRIIRSYFWHKMAVDVRRWLNICRICQQRKITSRPNKAPLQKPTHW